MTKVRENRLRRMADRQGMQLVKSRRRDPKAHDFGTFMLVDLRTQAIVIGAPKLGENPSATIDEIEAWLTKSS
ncbi:hypothetical protein ACIA49_03465 [Kribbella sp. NPDC051587]|uniref:hypothetical protein n=1 Tax=Kribbella sp. NPDC051587 TaxID=3364119 RepID=UPI0037B5E353